MVDSFIKIKIIGMTDYIIERVHSIDSEISEISLYEVLNQVLREQIEMISKILEKLLEGRLLLIVNGLSVYRFIDIKSIKVKPGDEVTILPVVFGGCKQL